MSNADSKREPGPPGAARRAWEPMRLEEVGHMADILRQSAGGGKISVLVGDPGEPKKVVSTG